MCNKSVDGNYGNCYAGPLLQRRRQCQTLRQGSESVFTWEKACRRLKNDFTAELVLLAGIGEILNDAAQK